jgi:hypothetical protein
MPIAACRTSVSAPVGDGGCSSADAFELLRNGTLRSDETRSFHRLWFACLNRMDPGAQGFFVRRHEEAAQAWFLDNGAHPPKRHQSKIIGNWQIAPQDPRRDFE